jgi:hypothetical protein
MTEEEKTYKVAETMLMAARAIRLRDALFEALHEELNNFILETIGFDREDKIIYASLLSKVNDGADSHDVELLDLDASKRLLDLMERKLGRYIKQRDE